MERKYKLAAKAGFFCGIAPALAYVVYLFARFADSGGMLIALFSALYFLAPLVAGILAVKNVRSELHGMKAVMMVSGFAGAVEGAVISLSTAIIQIIAQWASDYYIQNYVQSSQVHAYTSFSVAAMPWQIPILVAMSAAIMAILAAVAGTIYALTQAEVKFK